MAGLSRIQALGCAGAIALSLGLASPAMALEPDSAGLAEGEMRLNGGVRLSAAYDPIGPIDPVDVAVPELIAAPAPAPADAASAQSTAFTLQAAQTEGSASALPWFQRFTVAPTEPQILWADTESFEMQAGDRWGVTLGYSQGERTPQNFELEDFRAGAFFELTDRVRLGGQLRFTSPEEEIFGEETEDRAPEVRFESAFKF